MDELNPSKKVNLLNAQAEFENFSQPIKSYLTQNDEDDTDIDDEDLDVDDENDNEEDDYDDDEVDEISMSNDDLAENEIEIINSNIDLNLASEFTFQLDSKNNVSRENDLVDLVAQNAQAASRTNENDETREENLYKLYKIILEQTDPVVWDNRVDIDRKDEQQELRFYSDDRSIINSSLENNDKQTSVDSDTPLNETKLTITSQIPYNSLNNRQSITRKTPETNKKLTVCQSDYWSNKKQEAEISQIKKQMSEVNDQDLIKLDTDNENSSSGSLGTGNVTGKIFIFS